MSIWVDQITGDIQSINTLNHYVGMRPIHAKSIRELEIIPKVLLALCVLAGLAALVGKRWILGVWYGLFAVMGTVGLWDLYRWGYEYGHDINPDAPIKIPGMVYQPPFIGMKKMLNITSYSYPDWGGWLIAAVSIVGVIPLLVPFLKKKKLLFGIMAVVVFSGCTNRYQPEPLVVGSDACHECKMTISDNRFGGEVILKTGKVFKFDSLDCIKSFVTASGDNVQKIFIVDFFAEGKLIEVEKAHFLHLPSIRGPMGQAIVASSERERLKALSGNPKAEIRSWSQIMSEGSGHSPHSDPHSDHR